MRWFSFLFTVRFWVLAWLVILFVGLTPVPPGIELMIFAAFLAHLLWFARRRIRRAVMARALARAEKAEEAEFPPASSPAVSAWRRGNVHDCGSGDVALSVPRDGEGTGCRPAVPSPTTSEWAVFRTSPDGSLVVIPQRFLTGPHQLRVNLEIPLPVRVRKLVHVSDLHPAQWEGRTESGDFIFVRYRYGRLWIGLAPDYRRTAPTTLLETGYGELGDGYLWFRSLRKRTRGVVDWPNRTSRPGLTLDADTRYRRYAPDQIGTAQVIRRFRDLDMPLEDIQAVLNASDVETRNKVIANHLARLEANLGRTQDAVASLRDLLEQPAATLSIHHRYVPATPAAAITETIQLADALIWFRGALGELAATVAAQHFDPAGPAGAVYADELFADERGEATIFVPCTQKVRPMGRVARLVIPPVELATVVHSGPHAGIDRAYGALGAYVTRHALGIDGPIREYYLVSPTDTDDETIWRTEVGWPIFQTRPTG